MEKEEKTLFGVNRTFSGGETFNFRPVDPNMTLEEFKKLWGLLTFEKEEGAEVFYEGKVIAHVTYFFEDEDDSDVEFEEIDDV